MLENIIITLEKRQYRDEKMMKYFGKTNFDAVLHARMLEREEILNMLYKELEDVKDH